MNKGIATPFFSFKRSLLIGALTLSHSAYALSVLETNERFLNKPALTPDLPANTVLPTKSPPSHPISTASVQLFLLKKVHLRGNTVFSAAQLAPIIERYVGREVNADDLRQLRQELTVFYLDKGYINSGAILPKQAVDNGELTVDIIEGRLGQLTIEGLHWLRESYVRQRLAPNASERVLNIKEIQTNLQLLQQNPLIQRIHAQLLPSLQAGKANLSANIEEQRPYFATFGTSNNGVPSVGAERFEFWGGHRDLLGFGDALTGNVLQSAGQNQYGIAYDLPFSRWDTSLQVHYSYSEANVVEKPFDQLNIFNRSEAIAIGISQPVWRTLENQFTLGLSAEHRHSAAFLSDQTFQFSRGSNKGVSNVSVLRFSQEWVNHSQEHIIALRSVANWGLGLFDATLHKNPALPDSEYFFWLGQAQWIQRLGQTGLELHLQTNAQLASDALLSVEQYALGGMNSVRGYRKNQSVRDSGFASSVELRIPVLEKQLGNRVLQLAPFFDVGRSWSASNAGGAGQTLTSVGIGVQLDPNKYWHLECYWALPLNSVQTTGTDLQDVGVHFAINFSPLP